VAVERFVRRVCAGYRLPYFTVTPTFSVCGEHGYLAGEVAAVVFAQGCNFRCPFCHNGSLLPMATDGAALLPAASILEVLAKRRPLLDGVVVSGGEPTLQEGLPAFLEGLKGMGFATKLDTNGGRPGVLATLFRDRLVDFVAMDVKAPLVLYARLAGQEVDAGAICESIRVVAESGVSYEFRTTFVPKMLTKTDLAEIRALVPRGSPWRIQPFRPEHALDPRLRLTNGERV